MRVFDIRDKTLVWAFFYSKISVCWLLGSFWYVVSADCCLFVVYLTSYLFISLSLNSSFLFHFCICVVQGRFSSSPLRCRRHQFFSNNMIMFCSFKTLFYKRTVWLHGFFNSYQPLYISKEEILVMLILLKNQWTFLENNFLSGPHDQQMSASFNAYAKQAYKNFEFQTASKKFRTSYNVILNQVCK